MSANSSNRVDLYYPVLLISRYCIIVFSVILSLACSEFSGALVMIYSTRPKAVLECLQGFRLSTWGASTLQGPRTKGTLWKANWHYLIRIYDMIPVRTKRVWDLSLNWMIPSDSIWRRHVTTSLWLTVEFVISDICRVTSRTARRFPRRCSLRGGLKVEDDRVSTYGIKALRVNMTHRHKYFS